MKSIFLPVVLILSLACALPTHAQERGLSPGELLEPNHSDSAGGDEKGSPGERESKTKNGNLDSAMLHGRLPITPAAVKTKPADHKSESSKEEEDDALSFNFLYYIIQKFKISDLMDE